MSLAKCVASYLGSILTSTTPEHNKKIVHLKNCKQHTSPKFHCCSDTYKLLKLGQKHFQRHLQLRSIKGSKFTSKKYMLWFPHDGQHCKLGPDRKIAHHQSPKLPPKNKLVIFAQQNPLKPGTTNHIPPKTSNNKQQSMETHCLTNSYKMTQTLQLLKGYFHLRSPE